MAIVWTVNITNVDVVKKRADVNFTRLNDATQATENYRFGKTIIETGAQRTALLNLVWDKHLEAVDDQTAIDAFITNLEQLGKSNLEAREV